MGYNINVEEWNEFTSSFGNVGVGYARWRIIMASVNGFIKNRKAKSLSRIYVPIPKILDDLETWIQYGQMGMNGIFVWNCRGGCLS